MAKSNTPYLVVEGLAKHYGDGEARVQVLDGITTTVNRGEICVMLGPSGSGKSTFLNLIGGLEGADGGTISVGNCELTALSSKDLGEYRRRELGFVFQFYNLVPDLTIRENIEVTAHLSDHPLPMEDLLRSLGLWEHRDKFPRQVSGGQQQRCAIARAIAVKPSLILADEPTGNLDKKTGREILQIFRELHQAGNTIVLITHDPKVAQSAERVIRIEDGQLYENQEVPQDDLPVV